MSTSGSAKKTRRMVIILLATVAVLGLAAGVLHALNHWRVEFSVADGETEQVECRAGDYTPPAVTALLKGDLFCPDGKPLDVTLEGEVDPDTVGDYVLTWHAGSLFFGGQCVRTVQVVDTTPPVLTLVPEEREYILPGTDYDDPGFAAVDAVDGDLTDKVSSVTDGDTVTYTVTDTAGNTATAARTIPYGDPVPPVITLKGSRSMVFQVGTATYSEPGYTAEDNLDGDLTDKVTVSGTVDDAAVGTYAITYTVTDSHGNIATERRTVRVSDTPRALVQEDVPPSGPLPDKVIYLTFDDGPSQYTPKLLEVLDKYNVKATFFVVNTGRADLIAKEAAAGHTVAVHTLTHDFHKVYASEEAYFNDLWAMNEIIKQKTGSYTSLIRFPGGSSNTISKFNPGIMTRLTKAVEEAGFVYFDWNVYSGDAGETTSTDRVYQNVINGIKNRSSSVVLQHDIKGFSVNAVERIIQWGLENGYTFLPLSPDSPTCHHGINN